MTVTHTLQVSYVVDVEVDYEHGDLDEDSVVRAVEKFKANEREYIPCQTRDITVIG